jgi:hypothetical protein
LLTRLQLIKSYDNIIKRLKQQGDEAGLMIAAEIEKRIKEVFPEAKE